MIAAADLLAELAAHEASGEEERTSLEKIRSLLRGAPDPFTRERADHVTGSAIVARPDGSAFLLVHHRRLERWLQPGGHVEPDDRSVFETAVREAREETGLEVLQGRLGRRALDVDVHPIRARQDRPAHVHYDIRYLVAASGGAVEPQESEVREAAWFTLPEALASGVDPSLARALGKAAHLLRPAVPFWR